MGTNIRLKKLRWFDVGAESYALVRPGESSVPLYPCPICLTRFERDAVDDGRLTAEDVPPKAMGGKPLLLTCQNCNNTSGQTIDADAVDHDDLREVLRGRSTRRAVARVAGETVRGEFRKGQFVVLPHINRPDMLERLRQRSLVGSRLDVDFRLRSELGKNVSWFKAGYLILVAQYGFKIALDPAMEIVRNQILEFDRKKMDTFLREDGDTPGPDRRLICHVLSPGDHRGYAVRVGRFWIDYPSAGDMTFYDRLARYAGVDPKTQVEVIDLPTHAHFGFDAPYYLRSGAGAHDQGAFED